MEALLILCTCPDKDTARKIAHTLVENKLAACVNIIPNLESIYYYDGKICSDKEEQLLIKSTESNYSHIEELILSIHPYETPELIALHITQGSSAYMKWLTNACT